LDGAVRHGITEQVEVDQFGERIDGLEMARNLVSLNLQINVLTNVAIPSTSNPGAESQRCFLPPSSS
jgi:hypothetical protein